jgi:hypothetical protein
MLRTCSFTKTKPGFCLHQLPPLVSLPLLLCSWRLGTLELRFTLVPLTSERRAQFYTTPIFSMSGCGHTGCEFRRLLVARIRTVYVRTHSHDQGVHTEYDYMQLVLREQWTVTVMGEWDFCLMENTAIILLLL